MHIQLKPEVSDFSSIQMSLQRFWEIEEISVQPDYTDEESKCIEQFNKNVVYDNNCISVSLPF